MSLDDLISDDDGGDVHPKSVKATNEKLRKDKMCPSCGSANTKEGITFDYCRNKDCNKHAFSHPQYEVDLDKKWD